MVGLKLLLSPPSLSSVHFSAKDKLAGHEWDDERGSAAAVVDAKLLLTRNWQTYHQNGTSLGLRELCLTCLHVTRLETHLLH